VSAEPAAVRTLAFGDLDSGVWGAALHDGSSLLVLGTAEGARSLSPSLSVEGVGAAERWLVRSEDIELVIEPVSEPPAGDGGAFDQLCRVQVKLAADTQAVECSGTRWFRPDLDLGRFDSLRALSASFGPGEAIAVFSLRPRDQAGHDADLVSASVFEKDSSAPVGDARLSTTYGDDGVPARVSLELWQGEGEDEFPRRAAGEAAGQGAVADHGARELRAELFRLYSRDVEAAGVYLLARPR
jgi:hypothetical protein